MCTNSVERLVQCDRCLIWYCCGCAEIPMRLQEVLCEFTELHWFCHRCDKITIKIIRNFNDETTPTITPTPTTDETTFTSNIIASITSAISTATKSLQRALQETINSFQNLIHTVPTTVSNSTESTSMDAESPTLTPGLLPRPESLTAQDVSQAVSSCMSEEKRNKSEN